MLNILFYIILFSITLYCYINRKKGVVLLCLIALCYNCFGFLDPSSSSIKGTDIVAFFSIITYLDGISRNKRYLQVKNDPIGIVIVLILVYFILNFLGTVILQVESLSNAIKVIRSRFIFLLYFYLRTFKKEDFKLFIKWVLVASIIQGVFFYLQLVGINVLSGRVDEAEDVGELTRYANYPKFAYFFVIYYVISHKESTSNKIFLITFFGTMYILGQMRGAIISSAAVIGVFFLLKKKMKYVGYIAIGVIVYQFVVAPMFEYRTRNNAQSTFREMVNVVKAPANVYQQYTMGESSGNFSFRIAMLSERIIFMFHNPQYLPFGVGCIHETSNANHFYFHIRTHSIDAKEGAGTLSSADITWVGILMRYGLVCILFFLLLLYVWAKEGIPHVRKCNDTIFITSAVMVIYIILGSFNSDNLGRIPSIVNILFYLAVIYRNNHDKKRHLLYNKLCRESEKGTEASG